MGEESFKKQTYLCMLGAGLQRKTDIESWRSGNVWGTLMWQLAEIWPTGGWGSLECVNKTRTRTHADTDAQTQTQTQTQAHTARHRPSL